MYNKQVDSCSKVCTLFQVEENLLVLFEENLLVCTSTSFLIHKYLTLAIAEKLQNFQGHT